MTETPADRTIVTQRLLPFPRETVFRALSDPAILTRWWGPNGFSSTFHQFDFREGGAWRLTLHGPDGQDFDNTAVFSAIKAPESLGFFHSVPHHYTNFTTFEAVEGGTVLTMAMTLPTVEEYTQLKPFIAPANEQNFDRLEAALATLA